TPEEQEQLLTTRAKAASNGDIYADARRLLVEECDADNTVEQMQCLDTRLYLAEDILTKVDRASMAVSLEVRAPFLDPRVAEYAASLPVEYKLHGRTTKYILKRAARDLLSPERLRKAGLFDASYVGRLQDEHERGIANHRKLLWTLLMFELWHESFIETARRIETSVGSENRR